MRWRWRKPNRNHGVVEHDKDNELRETGQAWVLQGNPVQIPRPGSGWLPILRTDKDPSEKVDKETTCGKNTQMM